MLQYIYKVERRSEMYIDDMEYNFNFKNQFKEIGSCMEFSEYDENTFDYIDDFQKGDFESSMEFAEFEFENEDLSY